MKGGRALTTEQRRDYLEQAGRKRSRQDQKLRQLWMTQPRERTETEEERQTTTKDQDGTESTGVTRVTRQKGHRPRPPNSCSLKTGSARPTAQHLAKFYSWTRNQTGYKCKEGYQRICHMRGGAGMAAWLSQASCLRDTYPVLGDRGDPSPGEVGNVSVSVYSTVSSAHHITGTHTAEPAVH